MKEFIHKSTYIYYRTNDFQLNRETLVFVHGLSGSSSAWLPYEKKFEGKYNLFFFDLRGHGKSIKYKKCADYSIANFAKDLEIILADLGIGNFILISHSFGTLIALEYLFNNQNIAKAAVFLSPGFAPRKRFASRIVEPFLRLYSWFEFLPFKAKTGTHIDYRKYLNTGDWNLRRMRADVGNTGLRAYLYGSLESLKFDREDFLPEIKIPCLIMQGKRDTIFPVNNSKFMAEKIKDSKLILLDRADHILVLNNFSEVSDAMEDFVDKLEINSLHSEIRN